MNTLSWFLYWASVAPALSTFVCIVAFIFTAVFGITWLLGVTGLFGDEAQALAKIAQEEYHSPSVIASAQNILSVAPRFRRTWPLFVLSLLIWAGSFLVPDRDTFYMIAASETGEQVLNTPEAVKARAVLNKWLDGQLSENDSDNSEGKM